MVKTIIGTGLLTKYLPYLINAPSDVKNSVWENCEEFSNVKCKVVFILVNVVFTLGGSD